jgi:hypothetical protein
MTRTYLAAALCPDARLVDALRAKLPPQYVDLRIIGKLLAYDDTTRPCECDILAALRYLEDRAEVERRNGKGWRLAPKIAKPEPWLEDYLYIGAPDLAPQQLSLPGVTQCQS